MGRARRDQIGVKSLKSKSNQVTVANREICK